MPLALHWFRRDLRLHDNTALSRATAESDRVWCCFVFDRDILDQLADRADRRVQFIHESITELNVLLRRRGSALIVCHGHARREIPRLARELGVNTVYANHDYEPACNERDRFVASQLKRDGRALKTSKDHVVFEKSEVLSKSGTPYRIYSQYRRAWREKLTDESLAAARSLLSRLAPPPRTIRSDPWSLRDLGFEKTDLSVRGGTRSARKRFRKFLSRIHDYDKMRDFPAIDGTSQLSMHLRFGTISTREIIREALDHGSSGAQKWVDELVWRDFYNMILHHFPHTVNQAFQSQFRDLRWRRDKGQFSAWCEGRTGYPIVDAAMRQLNNTGYMHNRLRMITANFLTKDLRVDWRWGERYFARKLLDFDLSQNLGGWQWSASIGTDAQPYFRIMNPVAQSKKFDASGEFIRRFVPELSRFADKEIHEPWLALPDVQRKARCLIGRDYPAPIVDHAAARLATLAMFRFARKKP